MTQQSEQKNLGFDDRKENGPVECLGMEFPDDDARREYFTEKLREKLQDPKFRKIEGFPIGEDEDILALSDPPYYTACPNPFLEDFIKYYGKPFNAKEKYHREPFAANVKEGKSHPIYKAHSYHTKVPHKAIMRYILNYTEPGEIVFDGFCGTGMTGVAAQLCDDRLAVQELGFRVKNDRTIIDEQGVKFSKIPRTTPPWKLHEGKGYETLSAAELIRRLEETRAASLKLVKGLKNEDWVRQGTLMGTANSILDLGSWLTNHDRGHLAQIKKLC